jgi:hypothetical protein
MVKLKWKINLVKEPKIKIMRVTIDIKKIFWMKSETEKNNNFKGKKKIRNQNNKDQIRNIISSIWIE